MKQKLLLLVTLLFFFSVGFAQSRTGQQITVTDMNSVLFPKTNSARLSSSDSGSEANTSIDSGRLKSLVTQVQAATYYFEGTVNTFGSAPVNLYTDLGSLNQVGNAITQKDNIELVTIRINTASELNSTIDLAVFSNFPNLKYIYFITKLNTTDSGIASRIVNYNSRFNILYKIDKGDSNQ